MPQPTRSPAEIRSSIEANRVELGLALERLRLLDDRAHRAADDRCDRGRVGGGARSRVRHHDTSTDARNSWAARTTG